jgi:hypothetical protein
LSRASRLYIAVADTPGQAVSAVRAAVTDGDVEVSEDTFRVGPETVAAMGLTTGQVVRVETTTGQ